MATNYKMTLNSFGFDMLMEFPMLKWESDFDDKIIFIVFRNDWCLLPLSET